MMIYGYIGNKANLKPMNIELIGLIKAEKKALIKGWILSLLVIFPFTFFPSFFQEGPLMARLVDRLPMALLYTFLLATGIVAFALIYNFDALKSKIKLYKKAAFQSLNFDYYLEGAGSIVNELNVVFRGDYEGIHYRIAIVNDIEEEKGKDRKLMINPLPQEGFMPENKVVFKELRNSFKRGYELSYQPEMIEVLMDFQDHYFDDPGYILKYLSIFNGIISSQGSRLKHFADN